MIQTTAGIPFEALVTGAGPGLVGTITCEVYDPGPPVAVILPAATTGIVEVRPGTYQAIRTVNVGGSFMFRWVAPIGSVEEELLVTAQQLVVVSSGVRESLKSLVAADQDPALTATVLDDLLAAAAYPDRYGVAPGNVGWLPTYDLVSAAAAGWRRKAALAASSFAYSSDGEYGSRSIMHLRCLDMVRMYERQIVTSVQVSTNNAVTLDVELLA